MAAVGAGLIMWSGAGRGGYVWSGMEEGCWVVGLGGRGGIGERGREKAAQWWWCCVLEARRHTAHCVAG